ncbi:STAS domain-containing protein [Streptomyces iconiensis]|uniref:STAS domain-containing protein n=1 Tax=Streptomyces iconiensis TaxID=1384038 RepID=A0ABT7ABZ8_9ACTN|nr:STAS domain-containing protein [Streptomyces iconiensis]MDJ1138341.1 STAS domain-containing protein [Streptomyces iconiensis]
MSAWDTDRLSITSLAVGDECAVLRLSGELDHGSEKFYLDRIGAALSAGYRYLVLDVTALVFCDSRGLNCLLALRWLLHRRDGMLLLACVGRRLAHLLAVTGSTEVLPDYASVSQALATLPAEHRPVWPPPAGHHPDLPLHSPESVESSWQRGANPHLPPTGPEPR